MENTEESDIFAYDMAKNSQTDGELLNEDAINVSIENILMTNRGERVFLPDFGSILPLVIFETINQTNGELILDDMIESIKKWETRITILEDKVKLDVRINENALLISIPYKIDRNGLVGTFNRKILL
jgi:phage baseplate assembly protein W